MHNTAEAQWVAWICCNVLVTGSGWNVGCLVRTLAPLVALLGQRFSPGALSDCHHGTLHTLHACLCTLLLTLFTPNQSHHKSNSRHTMEIVKLASTLETNDEDWKARVKSLRSLASMVEKRPEAFGTDAFHTLHAPLETQVRWDVLCCDVL